MDIQELQDRYDELENIIDKLENLSNHIKYYKDFKADFEYAIFEAQQEKNRIEPELQKAYDEEEKAQNKEYWASQF